MKKQNFKYIAIILIAAGITVFVFLQNISTYRLAKEASESVLRNTSYFIGITLYQSLNRTGIDEELFLDIIKNQQWEEIAFIALYNSNGRILLHSSKRMINKIATDPNIKKHIIKETPSYYYKELATGETVYILDMPVGIHRLNPETYLLRVALHTYPASAPIRYSKVHALTASVFVLFLWALTVLFIIYSRRVEALQRREYEKRNLLRIGEMAAVLAHQIRSPLSAIKGFAQYIQEKPPEDETIKEGISVIVSESKRLEHLTEELLLYAKSREIRTDSFYLDALIEEVLMLFEGNDKGITFRTSLAANDLIVTDREKLRHILINIIQNAIEASEPDGVITIETNQPRGMIEIRITDQGVGMDEETLKRTLEPFFTTKPKGTGLGLSIVDDLTRALGGRLKIQSSPGKGTTVTITISGRLK